MPRIQVNPPQVVVSGGQTTEVVVTIENNDAHVFEYEAQVRNTTIPPSWYSWRGGENRLQLYPEGFQVPPPTPEPAEPTVSPHPPPQPAAEVVGPDDLYGEGDDLYGDSVPLPPAELPEEPPDVVEQNLQAAEQEAASEVEGPLATQGQLVLQFHPPANVGAGQHALTLHVEARQNPNVSAQQPLQLEIPEEDWSIQVSVSPSEEPQRVKFFRRKAVYQVALSTSSNRDFEVEVTATPAQPGALKFKPGKRRVLVERERKRNFTLQVWPTRCPLLGEPQQHSFNVQAVPAEKPDQIVPPVPAVLEYRPFPRPAGSFLQAILKLGLALAAVVAGAIWVLRAQAVLEISTVDEQGNEVQGAAVFVGDKLVPQPTPCTYTFRSIALLFSKHDSVSEIKATKEGWAEGSKKLVAVSRGHTLASPKEVTIRLSRPANLATLVVESTPGATVKMDGVEKGILPESGIIQLDVELKEGEKERVVNIALDLEGYKPWAGDVRVKPGMQRLPAPLTQMERVPSDQPGTEGAAGGATGIPPTGGGGGGSIPTTPVAPAVPSGYTPPSPVAPSSEAIQPVRPGAPPPTAPPPSLAQPGFTARLTASDRRVSAGESIDLRVQLSSPGYIQIYNQAPEGTVLPLFGPPQADGGPLLFPTFLGKAGQPWLVKTPHQQWPVPNVELGTPGTEKFVLVASPDPHSEEEMWAQFKRGRASRGFVMETVTVQVD